MNILTEEFRGKILRYSIVPNNGVLFNTFDVARILGGFRNQTDKYPSKTCIDMEGIINAVLTSGKNRTSFVRWLEAKFIDYRWAVPILPHCDDEWG